MHGDYLRGEGARITASSADYTTSTLPPYCCTEPLSIFAQLVDVRGWLSPAHCAGCFAFDLSSRRASCTPTSKLILWNPYSARPSMPPWVRTERATSACSSYLGLASLCCSARGQGPGASQRVHSACRHWQIHTSCRQSQLYCPAHPNMSLHGQAAPLL